MDDLGHSHHRKVLLRLRLEEKRNLFLEGYESIKKKNHAALSQKLN